MACFEPTEAARFLKKLEVRILCTLCSRKVRFRFHGRFLDYCWFSHDVTKTQTKKLSILPRFYFHDVLEQLKTNFHTNFRFKRALGFVMEYA